jgi:hypothetical protein
MSKLSAHVVLRVCCDVCGQVARCSEAKKSAYSEHLCWYYSEYGDECRHPLAIEMQQQAERRYHEQARGGQGTAGQDVRQRRG